MKRSEIKEKLYDIYKVTTRSNSVEFDEKSNLVTDLGLNSVGILYMVIAIEEFFGIRFDDIDSSELKTLENVIDYIEKKVE